MDRTHIGKAPRKADKQFLIDAESADQSFLSGGGNPFIPAGTPESGFCQGSRAAGHTESHSADNSRHQNMARRGEADMETTQRGSLGTLTSGVGMPDTDRDTATEPGVSIFRRFMSGNAETRAALGDLCGQLAACGLTEDDLGTIELVLAEALNNITEHAYGPEGGPVEVEMAVSGPEIRCELRDYGRTMPMGQAPVTELPLVSPPDILPEGGFGWHIIRCLVSDLRYERRDGHNRLRMALAVAVSA